MLHVSRHTRTHSTHARTTMASVAERLRLVEQDLASVNKALDNYPGKERRGEREEREDREGHGDLWSRLEFKGSSSSLRGSEERGGAGDAGEGARRSVHERLSAIGRGEGRGEARGEGRGGRGGRGGHRDFGGREHRDAPADSARRRESRDELAPLPPRKRPNNEAEESTEKTEETAAAPETSEDSKTLSSVVSVAAAERPVRRLSSGGEGDKMRNKRLFGVILGTLQQAQKARESVSATEKKFAEVEKRLEEKERQERQGKFEERNSLIEKKRQLQKEVQRLKREQDVAAQIEAVSGEYKRYSNFIRLKSTPKIFYLPAKHTEATLALLRESEDIMQEELASLRKRLTTQESRESGEAGDGGEGEEGDEAEAANGDGHTQVEVRETQDHSSSVAASDAQQESTAPGDGEPPARTAETSTEGSGNVAEKAASDATAEKERTEPMADVAHQAAEDVGGVASSKNAEEEPRQRGEPTETEK